jgi:hypothetical protein
MDPELAEIYGIMRPGQVEGPEAGIDFSDPSRVDWGRLAREFELSPQEVQELQIPDQTGTPLAERFRRMVTRGGVEWGVDGNQVTGKVRY